MGGAEVDFFWFYYGAGAHVHSETMCETTLPGYEDKVHNQRE
jgi:hypothetical protein